MAAYVWKTEVRPGDELKAHQVVIILEIMKMEVNVCVPQTSHGSKVHSILKKPGRIVNAGEVLLIVH